MISKEDCLYIVQVLSNPSSNLTEEQVRDKAYIAQRYRILSDSMPILEAMEKSDAEWVQDYLENKYQCTPIEWEQQ